MKSPIFDFPLPSNTPKIEVSQLKNMIDLVDTCPLKNSGIRVVYPSGKSNSKIMFIGEAPGKKEDQLGIPFVGSAGKFLNEKLLSTIGLTRNDVYITNIVKCRPPENRDPLDMEIRAWSNILLAEVVALKPNLIVCLGRHSLGFFDNASKISTIHGQVFKKSIYQDLAINILALYHPAVALYNPKMGQVLISDFQIIAKYL